MAKDHVPFVGAAEMSTAEAIALLAKSIQAQNPSDLQKTGMSPERQAVVQGRTPGRRTRDVPGVGENGATFLIHVVEDPEYANGRCVWFTQYRFPPGTAKHRAAGGKVPDGMRIAFDATGEMMISTLPDGEDLPQRACTREYVLWRLAEFHQLDSRTMIGKELRGHFCDPKGEGLKTPWVEPVTVAA